MNPWGQTVYDTLGALVNEKALEEISARGFWKSSRSLTFEVVAFIMLGSLLTRPRR